MQIRQGQWKRCRLYSKSNEMLRYLRVPGAEQQQQQQHHHHHQHQNKSSSRDRRHRHARARHVRLLALVPMLVLVLQSGGAEGATVGPGGREDARGHAVPAARARSMGRQRRLRKPRRVGRCLPHGSAPPPRGAQRQERGQRSHLDR